MCVLIQKKKITSYGKSDSSYDAWKSLSNTDLVSFIICVSSYKSVTSRQTYVTCMLCQQLKPRQRLPTKHLHMKSIAIIISCIGFV